jgi:hypothetical protein
MRLGDDARKCVVFFGKPDFDGSVAYGGTGFFVEYEDPSGHTFRYLVTANHVASQFVLCDVIRMNLRVGGAENVVMEDMNWVPHPTADIAVTRYNPPARFDVSVFPLKHGLTEEKRVEKNIECGDICYIVGLFRLHWGSKKNVPFVHTGHIAVTPDEDELVLIENRATKKRTKALAYIIEAQTLDGLSGSPVFVRRGVKAELAQFDTAIKPLRYGAVFLLGVYIASWDGAPGEILEADRNFKGGARVPVGMGSVAPFDQILELIEGEELSEMRRQEIERRESGSAMTTDSAGSPAVNADFSTPGVGSVQSTPNPTHREDFMRLVDAAARKKPRDE